MKFEFEIECKLDTESKNKGKVSKKIKKKAINLAGKVLDVACKAVDATIGAIDKVGDALVEAEIALDDEIVDNGFNVDSEEDDDSSEDDDSEYEDVPLKEYTFWEYLDIISNYEVDDSSKAIDCEKEAEKFLKSIDFEPNDATLKAFETAVMLKKITYETVIEKVSECYPGITAEDIKDLFIDDFIHWLINLRPDVDETCKNVNFMLLVRYFVKKVRAS